jgi:hypothetical protein
MVRLDFPFPQIATSDLDIPIVGQLPAANVPFRDEFEPCLVQVVCFDAALRCWGFRDQELEDASETRTTPSYSPIPMPNSTTERFSGVFDPEGFGDSGPSAKLIASYKRRSTRMGAMAGPAIASTCGRDMGAC